MKSIGIIGAGVSSLHLGIGLRNAGVATTIYAPRTPENIESGSISNSVAHMDDTIQRERALGIEYWDRSNSRVCEYRAYHLQLPDGKLEVSRGALNGDERCVDYRLYLPKLMREFEQRGGKLSYESVNASNFDDLYEHHDLLAIGVGKKHDGFGQFFQTINELSAHNVPQRHITAGFYNGVTTLEPLAVTFNISVGEGELIELPIETAQGPKTALLIEARPESDLSSLMELDYGRDSATFNQNILRALERHFPNVYARVAHAEFGLVGGDALLQGKFTPVTRAAWSEVSDGQYAIAIGDLRCTMDPLTGQGANLASYGACELADHIALSDRVFDRNFCEAYEQRTQYRVAGVVNFNNELLEPAAHTRGLIHEFPNNQAICDDFSSRFARPETIWFDILKDEKTCREYRERMGSAIAA